MGLSIVSGLLTLLAAIAQGVGSLVSWIRESNFKKQGAQEVENRRLKEENEFLKKALDAREQARVANARVPQSDSLPDDGFRRD